jgi:hypothetical protein
MIYKILNSKYLLHKRFGFSIESKTALYATKVNFSADLWMNILIILFITNNYYYTFFNLKNFKSIVFISAIIVFLLVFSLVNSDKIIEVETNRKWKIISIIYSLLTYITFFTLITKVKFV